MRWTRHVLRMDLESITKATVRWIPPHGKRKPGCPKFNWIPILKEDIKRGGVSLVRIPKLAVDRKTWKELTAPCVPILPLKDLRSKVRPYRKQENNVTNKILMRYTTRANFRTFSQTDQNFRATQIIQEFQDNWYPCFFY